MLTQMTLERREMSWFKWQYIHYYSQKKKRELYEKIHHTSDKYLLKGILSLVTLHSPDKECVLNSALLRKAGSLESIRRHCRQGLLQHFRGWLKCKDTTSQGYFWEPRILWGCDMLSWSTEHLRALTGLSCLNSSYEAWRVSKPLKYNKQGQWLTCAFPPTTRLFPRTHKHFKLS